MTGLVDTLRLEPASLDLWRVHAEQNPGYSRHVSNFPPSLRGRLPPSLVHLGDAAPVSLISNESLADLNQKLNERVPGHTVALDRFRMNIEITGCSRPFELGR